MTAFLIFFGTIAALIVASFFVPRQRNQEAAAQPAAAAPVQPQAGHGATPQGGNSVANWATSRNGIIAEVIVGVIAIAFAWYYWEKLPLATFVAGALALFLITKAGSMGKWIGIPLMILVIFAGPNFGKLTSKWYAHTDQVIEGKKDLLPEILGSAIPSPGKVTEGTTTTARFAGREADGSLPVGIWSETTTIPAGCSVKFNAGIGTLYKVRYRFYTTEWKEHEGKGKGSPSASEIQFMPLQKGVTGIPFSMKCS